LIGLTQYVADSSLGLDFFGESKSQKVMAAGSELISRVSGTFGHPNSLAGYLVMLALLNLALFWAPLPRRLKMFLFPAFLLISSALILTYSRGGWLALGLGGMFTLYFCLARWSGHKIASFLITVSVAATFFITSVGLITPLRNRLFLEDYGAARSRLPMAQVALNVIYHHPLLGVGLGNYLFIAPDYDITREGIIYDFPRPVHNEFLLIGAEQGLPGLALFLLILGYLVLQLLRQSRSRDQTALPYIAIGLAGTFVAWSIFRFTDYNYVLLADPLWLLAGVSMALVRINREDPGIHLPSV
jgi:O-antigen ligase